MQLQPPRTYPLNHSERGLPPVAPAHDNELVAPASPDDVRRFYGIIDGILRPGANDREIVDALTTALDNTADRQVILSFLIEHGLPHSLKPQHRKPFIDAVLPWIEPEGQRGWDAAVSILESVVSLKDYQLYGHLGQEFCKRTAPELAVFGSAETFKGLLCINVARSPEVAAWVEFFRAQGTPESFQAIYTELWARVKRSDLSSYDHLVNALCTTKNDYALAIVETALNTILRNTRVVPQQQPSGLQDFLVQSLRSAPLSAFLVLVSAGPEHVASFATLALAGVLGATRASLKRLLRPTAVQQSPINSTNRSAFATLVDKVHGALASMENSPPRAEKIVRFLDRNIGDFQRIGALSTEPTTPRA